MNRKCFALRIVVAHSLRLTQLPIQNVRAKAAADNKFLVWPLASLRDSLIYLHRS